MGWRGPSPTGLRVVTAPPKLHVDKGLGRPPSLPGTRKVLSSVRPEFFVSLGPLHPHVLFEVLAYAIGFQLYRRARRRRGDVVDSETRWSVIVAAAVGAAVGSKLLAWAEHPADGFLISGKTIVGGLLGGWWAVEWAKRRAGVSERTGDLFAVPLCAGIAIGRVGCFLTGLSDKTYGRATELPWAIDLGDGVGRHPTQLYEILFLALLGLWLVRSRARLADGSLPTGALFDRFVVAYFAFRLAVDFLKPGEPHLGLTAIQWGAVAGLLYHARRSIHGSSRPTLPLL